jgi:hypothetical protein
MFSTEFSRIKRMCGAGFLNDQSRPDLAQMARIIMLVFILLVLALHLVYGSAQNDSAPANKEAVAGLAEYSAGVDAAE